MSTHPQPRHATLEDYWGVELSSPLRHEYLDGAIYAMAGAEPRHNEIVANLQFALTVALRERGCHPLGSDQRIRVSPTEYTYPDLTVFCSRMELAPGVPPGSAVNPTVAIEVLSDSTRQYDRTDKLAMYQRMASVREVLLVEPEEVRIEHWVRDDGQWRCASYTDPSGTFQVCGGSVAISEVYTRRIT